MLNKILLFSIGLLFCVFPAFAAGAPELKTELSRTFDAYNAAAKTGDVEKMLVQRTTESQKEIRKQIKKKEDREFFVMLGRAQVPESYEAQHVAAAKDGKSATLYVTAQFAAIAELERPRQRMEISISFKKEKGKWKFESLLPLGDPDKIARPKDLTYNYDDADTDKEGSIGGRIVKTEFKDDHTLVMLRIMDEENAVFLPRKEILEKSGMPLNELDPWNFYEFSGHPHKTDKLKFFATGGKLAEE